jgi:hypothetical protein
MDNEKPKGFVPPAPPIEQLEIFPIESKKNGTFQRLKDKVKTKNSNLLSSVNQNELPKIKSSKKEPIGNNQEIGDQKICKLIFLSLFFFGCYFKVFF